MYDSGTADSESAEESSSKLRDMIENGMKDWQAYKGIHGKSYDEETENERMLTFLMGSSFLPRV